MFIAGLTLGAVLFFGCMSVMKLCDISDHTKRVDRLGTRSPLPVEVVDWALEAHRAFLESTGATVELRVESGAPVKSDNGNVFFDCRYEGGITDPVELERRLAYRAGIVDTGLFLGMADEAVIASPDGVLTLRPERVGIGGTP